MENKSRMGKKIKRRQKSERERKYRAQNSKTREKEDKTMNKEQHCKKRIKIRRRARNVEKGIDAREK